MNDEAVKEVAEIDFDALKARVQAGDLDAMADAIVLADNTIKLFGRECERLSSDDWLKAAADELAEYIEQWNGPAEDGGSVGDDHAPDWLFRAVLAVLRKHRDGVA